MDIKRVTLEAQQYLYVDRECPYEGAEIARAMGSAFAEVFGFLKEKGIMPLAMPMTVYLGMDPEMLRFRGGVMVAGEDAKRAEGAVRADELPGGDAMTVVHTGAYANMNETHRALWAHMEAKGIAGAFPIWEIYADDPEEVAEGALRTEIFRAISGAAR